MEQEDKITLQLPAQQPGARETLRTLPQATIMALARRSVGATAADLLLNIRSLDSLELDEDIEKWANERLFSAVSSWNRYRNNEALCDWSLPMNITELKQEIPDLAEQLMSIYKAASISHMKDTAQILLVPYGAMMDHSRDLRDQMTLLREYDGLQPDIMQDQIAIRLRNYGMEIQYDYIDHVPDRNVTCISMNQYGTHMARNGKWGLLAIGEPKNVGCSALRMRNLPGEYTEGMHCKGFGIPEWFAYTLQMNPLEKANKLVLAGSNIPAVHAAYTFAAIGGFDTEKSAYNLILHPETSTMSSTTTVPLFNARA